MARYRILHGEFHITYPGKPKSGQPQPDGDTIKFKPDTPDLLFQLPRFGNVRPDLSKRLRMISVRFEGIDTLETHYPAGGRDLHQQLEFGFRARNVMMNALGFGSVTFHDDAPNVVRTVEHHPVRGFVVANGIESNGRLLAFVHTGTPPAEDGAEFFLTEAVMNTSVNLLLVREGLAYTELYTTLPIELAYAMRETVKKARHDGCGFWEQEDVGVGTPARVPDLDSLQQLVMFPKLFRRLAVFFATADDPALEDFDAWLRADVIQRDDRLLLPNCEFGNMHDLFTVEGDTIRLNFQPEDVTILPDGA